MAENDMTPASPAAPPAPATVADSTGALAYAVQAAAWGGALPLEVRELVAPPIVVSAAPIARPAVPASARRRGDLLRYRMNMPLPPRSGRHRRTAHAG